MTDLLDAAITAHGGLERWRSVRAVDIRFNYSGSVLELKGFPRHLQPSCSIEIDECRVTLQRLGGDPDDRWIFTVDRCWIERRDGSLVEERFHPRDAFADHVWETKWDALHLTYFIGYAMWNYITAPFLFAGPGFETTELEEHRESGETWRVLQVVYPDNVPFHSKVQRLYFGPDLLLRRLDYDAEVSRGVAAHYCYDLRDFHGIVIPTLRRVVSRTADGSKITGRTGFLLDYVDVAIR